jgi:hypothetical protein
VKQLTELVVDQNLARVSISCARQELILTLRSANWSGEARGATSLRRRCQTFPHRLCSAPRDPAPLATVSLDEEGTELGKFVGIFGGRTRGRRTGGRQVVCSDWQQAITLPTIFRWLDAGLPPPDANGAQSASLEGVWVAFSFEPRKSAAQSRLMWCSPTKTNQ